MAYLLSLIVNGVTRLQNDTHGTNIYADKHIKNNSNDNYILLGGGGHIDKGTFALANHGVHWDGFSKRATSDAIWGTLTSSNGYSPLLWLDSTNGGGVAFSDKSGQTSMQIDGYFYQNEGRYRLTDVTETVTALGTNGNYLTWTKNGTTNNITILYASSAGSVSWDNVSGKPSSYTPSSHTHDYLPLSGGELSGTLYISAGNNSGWTEGLRIKPANNGWTSLVLGNSGQSGTDANTWSIHTYTGNFYLANNGSSSYTNGLTWTKAGNLSITTGTVNVSSNVGIGITSPENKLDVNGVQQIYQRGNDNTSFKDLLLLKQQNSTEDANQDWTSSKPTFGIGFRRYWTSGSSPYGETTCAGIYATISSSWRGGLVFRTKNNQTQGGTHDTTALRLRPDGHAIFGSSVETNGFIKNGSSDSYVLLGGGGHKLESNLSVNYANSAGRLNLTSCYNGTTNNDLWSDIKTSNSSYLGTATIYEVYNDNGPDTYGEVLDIVSVHSNHWQPQLWFGAGKGGRLRYRNKDYNDNSWGNWYTVAFTSDIPTSLPANGGTSSAVTINYNNDSNSTYQMLWGSGNYVYGTGGIYCNPYTDTLYSTYYRSAGTIRVLNANNYSNYCEGLRLHAPDSTWTTIIMGCTGDTGTNTYAWSIHRKADNNFCISRNSSDGANGLLIDTSGRVGIGTTSPSYRLTVSGSLYSDGGQTFKGMTSIANKGNSASYTEAAVQIREYNFGGSQSDTWGNAPRLAWHWSGRVQAQIGLASDNHLYISEDGSFSTPRLILHSGNSYVTGGKGVIAGTTITQVSNADYAGYSGYTLSLNSVSLPSSTSNSANTVWCKFATITFNTSAWCNAAGYFFFSGGESADYKGILEYHFRASNTATEIGLGELSWITKSHEHTSVIAVKTGNNVYDFYTNNCSTWSTPRIYHFSAYNDRFKWNVGSWTTTKPTAVYTASDIGRVYYATNSTNAGNADTVDSQHFTYSNSSNSPTYLWATNSNGSSFLAARASMSVNYASSAGNADTVDGYHASSLWRSDGGTWNPTANISLSATSNSQEWSFDITRNGYTGCYWHVWDSQLSTMLRVNADDGKVSAPYGFVGNLSGTASSVTVNYNNNSNSTYQMLWGSGNYVYGTSGIYCNPSTDAVYATRYYANGSAGPHFTGTSTAGNWAYLRLDNSSVLWDIATNSSSTSVGANALDIREKGANYAGIAIRYNTSSYGRLVVMNNTNTETSIGYLNTKFSSSVPIWTVGAGIGTSTSFGWYYYNVGCKMYLTTDGYVYASAYFESSDQRLKNFYNSIDTDLDKLKSIPKKYFSWKKDNENKLHIGTSAQAIRELYPELVSESEDGMLSVDYAKLSIVALKAIDVLYDEIKLLKLTNSRLEKRIQELEK